MLGQIQIFKDRPFVDTKSKKKRRAFVLYKSIETDFTNFYKNLEKHVEEIPKEERYNLHYTQAYCIPETTRKMLVQNIVAFDLDGIDIQNKDNYIELFFQFFAKEIKEKESVTVVCSGNGLHFIISTNKQYRTEQEIKDERPNYNIICDKLKDFILSRQLPVDVDKNVFRPKATLRLPLTENRKKEGNTQAYIINPFLKTIDFDLAEIANKGSKSDSEYIKKEVTNNISIDKRAVLRGCKFIQYARENQEKIKEPQWFAMISTLVHLEGGEELIHAYSNEHPDYTKEETDLKIEHAKGSLGPRTCKNIDGLWDGCKNCSHYKKVSSPILISSATHIPTANTGFRVLTYNSNGEPKTGPFKHEDYAKYLLTTDIFKGLKSDDGVQHNFVYKYEEEKGIFVKYMRDRDFAPQLRKKVKESKNQDKVEAWSTFVDICDKYEAYEWEKSTGRFIAFENGVLDVITDEFKEHSPEFMLRHSYPFKYDPEAKCPRFNKYLDEVFEREEESSKEMYINTLLEFSGFIISNTPNRYLQKAIILYGDGANGKSVYLQMIKHMLVGNGRNLDNPDYVSSISLKQISDDKYAAMLFDSLVNISEETPKKAVFEDDSRQKQAISGDEMTGRRLYGSPIHFRCNTKFIMASNHIPQLGDLNTGILRRFVIIPFNTYFEEDKRDPMLLEKLIKETPGIFNLFYKYFKELKKNKFKLKYLNKIHLRTSTQLVKGSYEESGISEFMDEHVDMTGNQDDYVTNDEMYNQYRIFCDDNGIPLRSRRSKIAVGMYIKKVFPEIKLSSKREQGRTVKVRLGIKLKNIVGDNF